MDSSLFKRSRMSLLLGISLLGCLVACGQPPEYHQPEMRNTQTSPTQGASSNSGKSTDAAGNKQTMPATESSASNTSSSSTGSNQTPATEPTAPKPPATNPSLGIVATGKTLVMQNCVAGCHQNNTIDAKTSAALAAGNSVGAHSANLKNGGYFVAPAEGAAATNFSHVLAFLMSVPTAVKGPLAP